VDEAYQTYVERVARLTRPETYRAQLANIQQSPKFARGDSGVVPVAFPGYSVLSPPAAEDLENSRFYRAVATVQKRLLAQWGELLVPVPPESFHLTVADLIWADAYRDALATNPDFTEQLRAEIAASFATFEDSAGRGPLAWQGLGVLVRPRAIAIALLPKDEDAYVRLLALRRSLYQNRRLLELGIEQQYHYTAHVTMGYFGAIPPDLDRAALAAEVSAITDEWFEGDPPVLTVRQAELRHFADMTRFERHRGFPAVEF